MQSYCGYARARDDVHREHHDTEHGFLPRDDDDLFRRLMLEISQAGLSFETVLKRKQGIYRAFNSVDKVAKFGAAHVKKLMQDASIIRHRLKILAAIKNAQKIKELQKEFGSFKQWLDAHHPRTREEWVQLFKKTFTFTGGEIVNEFLMSTGYLPGAHDADCPVLKNIRKK